MDPKPCEPGAEADDAVAACDPRAADCSTFANKHPPVTATVTPDISGLAATSSLDASSRRAFEHLLGHALGETSAVRWATQEFARRMGRFIIGGGALNGTSADDALSSAFITPECNQANTGYVGPHLPAIRAALAKGNIREVWGLMYVLTKTRYFTALMLALLSPRGGGGGSSGSPPMPPLATPSSLAARFGMDAAAVSARWKLVEATRSLPSSELQYSQGMPNFEWEAFDSWVHFDFDSSSHSGRLQWKGARRYRADGCRAAGMRTDDPSIEPPLSAAELAYQCGSPHGSSGSGGSSGGDGERGNSGGDGERGNSGGDGERGNSGGDGKRGNSAGGDRNSTVQHCELKWHPGALCFDLPNASWVLPPSGERVPGLNERAALLGYRSAAAASGTTANMLQLATYLGLKGDELAILRAALLAWMLPSDDHSFFEILLGADRYVAPQLRMVMGLHDLGRLWPPNVTLSTYDGRRRFHGVEVWRSVARRVRRPEGEALLRRMAPDARAYLLGLITAAEEERAVEGEGKDAAVEEEEEEEAVQEEAVQEEAVEEEEVEVEEDRPRCDS